MIARVATFNHLPDDLNDQAVERLRRIARETPGYHAGYHGRNFESGRGLSLLTMDEAAFRAVGERLGARAQEERVGIDPDLVEFFELTPFESRPSSS
jgi:hypothetical protein